MQFNLQVEATVAAVEEKLENIIVEEQKLGNIVVQEEEKIAELVETVGVRNIAEALLTIDNEIKAEQVRDWCYRIPFVSIRNKKSYQSDNYDIFAGSTEH